MKASSSMLQIFLFSLLTLFLQLSHSTTIVVDGISDWKDPSVHIGDSIIFKNKYHHYKLYIFRNEKAFNLCNLSQATLLTNPNSSSFTWHPSRLGFFYFSFSNGSTIPCHEGQKLAIRVSPTQPISPLSAPAPTSGGIIPSNPAYQFPLFGPQQPISSPTPAPTANSPETVPTLVPDKGGGMPFINSNPAVPLPTGEVDSATIRPLPTSGHEKQVVGLLTAQMLLCFAVLLML